MPAFDWAVVLSAQTGCWPTSQCCAPIQRPLSVRLGLGAQSKAVELLVVPQVGKNRLHGSHALAIQLSASGAINGMRHAFGELVSV